MIFLDKELPQMLPFKKACKYKNVSFVRISSLQFIMEVILVVIIHNIC